MLCRLSHFKHEIKFRNFPYLRHRNFILKIMIKHIVLFKFKTCEGKEESIRKIKASLESLPSIIPELRGINVGINVNAKEKWDMCLEAIVENLHDLEVYASHPAHVQIVTSMIAPVKEDRACIDIQL